MLIIQLSLTSQNSPCDTSTSARTSNNLTNTSCFKFIKFVVEWEKKVEENNATKLRGAKEFDIIEYAKNIN